MCMLQLNFMFETGQLKHVMQTENGQKKDRCLHPSSFISLLPCGPLTLSSREGADVGKGVIFGQFKVEHVYRGHVSSPSISTGGRVQKFYGDSVPHSFHAIYGGFYHLKVPSGASKIFNHDLLNN